MMSIRDATSSDAANLARLTNQLGYAADVEAITQRLARLAGRPEDLVIVAVMDDDIVGWLQAHACVVLESGFYVEIVGLVVSETCRRCGIGRHLVQRAERWAEQLGAEALVVRSNIKRVESHVFYPALGFAPTKTQSVYRKRLPAQPNHTLQSPQTT